MDAHSSSGSDSGSIKDAAESSTDVEQHCLLFPTYATRFSRSGMARKLAGVTRDDEVYETLESRFGMFLASNTQGATFSIQCVGLAKTSQMELAGATNPHDQAVDVLKDEMNTSDGALAVADVFEDKAQWRKSLEEGQGSYIENTGRDLHINRDPPTDSNGRDRQYHQSVSQDYSKRLPASEEEDKSLSHRWAKSAAVVKGAYRKYKPMVVAQVSGSNYCGNNNSSASLGNLNVPPSDASSRSSTRPNSTMSHYLVDESSQPGTSPGVVRTESGDSVMSQTTPYYENLGHGKFPTVQVSSRPGGHFDGTLRVSRAEVMAHRKYRKNNGTHHGSRGGNGHPRFLKLHAYHPRMKEPCEGIVNLVDPEGISIISDIDDTIKETDIAAGAKTVLQNTFLKDVQDVPGMADVYQRWWKNGAAVHYVSNSPWQLIPMLLDFFHTHKFPPGSAHLKLHDSVLKAYFMTPGEHKRKTISEILTDFPHRKFVLIGDSGEIDMEIYTEMALKFPNQIFKIFIRDITTKRLQEMVAKAAAAPPPRSGIAGFFSRGDTSSTASVYSTDNADSKSLSGSTFDEFDPQPPKLPPRSNTFTSHSSTVIDGAALDDEIMPGAPPPIEPQLVKNPLEVWMDRIEVCKNKLPEDTLVLFEDSSKLEKDPSVSEMIQRYKASFTRNDDGSDDELKSAKEEKLVDV
ncbi:hypothetical protein BGZ58_005057 [Dissophora ornata]|nr:hypothetical protein BGZ58_005057 [Dissophora ornata]